LVDHAVALISAHAHTSQTSFDMAALMHAWAGDAKYPLNPVPINASPDRAEELRSSGNRHKVHLTKPGPPLAPPCALCLHTKAALDM
jgi:hypothetical protein